MSQHDQSNSLSELKSLSARQPLPGPFIALAGIGAVVSAVLIYHHVELVGGFQVGPSVCAIGEHFDCDKVSRSAYAELFGIPVASFALWFYLILFGLALGTRNAIRAGDEGVLSVFLSASLVSLIPSAFLLYVSIFNIGSLCMYCLLLDCTNVMLAIVSVRTLRNKSLPGLCYRGLVEILKFVFVTPWARSERQAKTIGVYFGTVVVSALIFSVPGYLESAYFMPRKKVRMKAEDIILDGWFKKWGATAPASSTLVDRGAGLKADFLRGKPNAELTVVEFADFQCGFCMKASKVVHQLLEKYGDRVAFVFKNFPLDSSCNAGVVHTRHEFGCRAAVMARCAGEQGSEFFWDMHDALFDLPIWTDYTLEQLPDQLGLDQPRFKSCMASSEVWDRIREDVAQAKALNVESTPTFFILQEGRQLQAPPFTMLDRLLERLFDRRS